MDETLIQELINLNQMLVDIELAKYIPNKYLYLLQDTKYAIVKRIIAQRGFKRKYN